MINVSKLRITALENSFDVIQPLLISFIPHPTLLIPLTISLHLTQLLYRLNFLPTSLYILLSVLLSFQGFLLDFDILLPHYHLFLVIFQQILYRPLSAMMSSDVQITHPSQWISPYSYRLFRKFSVRQMHEDSCHPILISTNPRCTLWLHLHSISLLYHSFQIVRMLYLLLTTEHHR